MILIDALRCYIAAWFGAFAPEGRRLAPLTPRRLLMLFCLPAAFLLFAVHGLCLALDNLLFPAYRRQSLKKPVFVAGVPRSGTTFLHRRLAEDSSFTTTATWELLLAPSVLQRRLVSVMGRLDNALGDPVARLLTRMVGAGNSHVEAVHEVALDAAEEDYLALLPAAGCFFALLAFPQSEGLRRLGDLSRLPRRRQQRLLNHYHRLLQRHVYVHGSRQLLSKNAAFASWLPFLAERYPDGVFVVCLRQPQTALSSQLSSLAEARSTLASLPQDGDLVALFADCYLRWYHSIEGWLTDNAERGLVVEQERLRENPQEVLSRIYERLGRECPTGGARDMQTSSSSHKHALTDWDISADTVAELEAIHDRVIALATNPAAAGRSQRAL